MRRRSRHQEDHENHERWLVSYADFITLLFAFFVVMYAVSSVNDGKMRVLSDSLLATFTSRQKSLNPIQVGELVRSRVVDSQAVITKPGERPALKEDEIKREESAANDADGSGVSVAEGDTPGTGAEQRSDGGDGVSGEEFDDGSLTTDTQGADADGPGDAQHGEEMKDVDSIADEVEGSMANLIMRDLVNVRRGKQWLEVEFKTSLLFTSGRATVAAQAVPMIEELAEILTGFPNPVQVEGFTDDVPINTATFPSNWELSAARAASVVALLSSSGVAPHRLAAVGFGEHRPIADNSTPEGRSKNRRVVLVIPAESQALRKLGLGRLSGESSASGLNTVQPWAEAPAAGTPNG